MRKLTLLCFGLILPVIQSPHPAGAQTSPSRSRKPAANVQSGTITAVDVDEATVTIKTKAGPNVTYRLTEKTQMWRGKKPAEAHSFTPGDGVVVRFRKSSVGPATLYDLADTASWAWVDRLRHETTSVLVKSIDEDSLAVTES